MRIIIGADHAGFALKGPIVEALRSWGHDVEDIGTYNGEPVDFPDVARRVCDPVRAGQADRGIMVCGTGIGACMAANKLPGIRAALCHDVYSAHQCVEHDDANVLCLGAQIVGDQLAFDLLRTYLERSFSTEEHFARRVQKLAQMEQDAADEIGRTVGRRTLTLPTVYCLLPTRSGPAPGAQQVWQLSEVADRRRGRHALRAGPGAVVLLPDGAHADAERARDVVDEAVADHHAGRRLDAEAAGHRPGTPTGAASSGAGPRCRPARRAARRGRGRRGRRCASPPPTTYSRAARAGSRARAAAGASHGRRARLAPAIDGAGVAVQRGGKLGLVDVAAEPGEAVAQHARGRPAPVLVIDALPVRKLGGAHRGHVGVTLGPLGVRAGRLSGHPRRAPSGAARPHPNLASPPACRRGRRSWRAGQAGVRSACAERTEFPPRSGTQATALAMPNDATGRSCHLRHTCCSDPFSTLSRRRALAPRQLQQHRRGRYELRPRGSASA